jgi:peptide/nickel transport system ATP-binding protein
MEALNQAMNKDTPILSIADLSVSFSTGNGPVRVVENVSVDLKRGQTLGLVGESGCGKSVTAMSVMRLLPSPPSKVESGRIDFDDVNLLALNKKEMRRVRGNRIGMIFQEPMTSLNPCFTIGFQIGEVLRLHGGLDRSGAHARCVELLEMVGVGAARAKAGQYPHQLSGGLRQRVMIAMALACNPSLLIADEPTTALDVTIQAQILDLMGQLQKDLNMAILLITHDLGVVAEFCDHVAVMYAGRIVETAPVEDVFTRPVHPYTQGLLTAIPQLGRRAERLPTIPGVVPSPEKRPDGGCYFAERCDRVVDVCFRKTPSLEGPDPSHQFACWHPHVESL